MTIKQKVGMVSYPFWSEITLNVYYKLGNKARSPQLRTQTENR